MKWLTRGTAVLLLTLLVVGLLKPITVSAGEAGWTEDYQKALAQAKREKKMVLLDFTGSDWCGWCVKLDQEVFSTADFQRYAAQNLVLVKLDFPRKKTQSTDVKKQNVLLARQFGIQGYPTIIVLNSQGKNVGQLGYQPGGPSAFIAELNKLKGK